MARELSVGTVGGGQQVGAKSRLTDATLPGELGGGGRCNIESGTVSNVIDGGSVGVGWGGEEGGKDPENY